MQWSRVKTILIITLFAANLFLAAYNITRIFGQNYLDTSFVQSASEALAHSGVTAPANVILHKRPKLPTLTVTSESNDLRVFSKLLLGENAIESLVNNNPTITSAFGRFTITSPSTFEYTAGTDPADIGKSPEAFAKSFFRKAGLTGCFAIIDSTGDRNSAKIVAEQVVSGTLVRGCRITFTIENGELTRVIGKWVLTKTATERSRSLSDAVNALFSISSSQNNIITPDSNVVTKMRLVYYSPDSTSMTRITLLPAYLITYDSGTSYLYDLTKGKLESDAVTVEIIE